MKASQFFLLPELAPPHNASVTAPYLSGRSEDTVTFHCKALPMHGDHWHILGICPRIGRRGWGGGSLLNAAAGAMFKRAPVGGLTAKALFSQLD